MIDITQIITDRHPYIQVIVREFLDPTFHFYCMEVEIPNCGQLSKNYSLLKLENEGNLVKYIIMISLAVEYLHNFGVNHGKLDSEHVYVSINLENGDIALKLSNLRSQMLMRE